MNERRFNRSGGNRGYRGGGGGRGGRRSRKGAPPILLSEPSPSLAKINAMNTAKLQAKIESLETEQAALNSRLERLKAVTPLPEERIKNITELLERLEALKEAANKRLAGKLERKALREQGKL